MIPAELVLGGTKTLLIYLLLVGPLRTDDEFVVFFVLTFTMLIVGMRPEKQDNSISIGSIIKKAPLSKQGDVLKQNTARRGKIRDEFI